MPHQRTRHPSFYLSWAAEMGVGGELASVLQYVWSGRLMLGWPWTLLQWAGMSWGCFQQGCWWDIATSGSPRLQSFWLRSWRADVHWWPIAGPGLLGSTSLHPVVCWVDVAYSAEAAGGLLRTWAPRSYGMGASPPPGTTKLMGWRLVGEASWLCLLRRWRSQPLFGSGFDYVLIIPR